ncbi:hypothetical protein EDC90_101916 [Martelella mediterranea]|uniref:Uncharacterized protein n=1 Tax=Martelella mediterranea TaxID=293089 RepID=A0A4R3NWW4_9HYPH|nr:hypothetical protein EDC90_101916 [Martelella mediterranea]
MPSNSSDNRPSHAETPRRTLNHFIVRLECRAWPYDYPPCELLIEAVDENDALGKAIEYDRWANILSISYSNENSM